MNDQEKIKFIKEQFCQHKVEINRCYTFHREFSSNFINYEEKDVNEFNIEINLHNKLIISDDSYLDDIISKIELLKNEIGELNLNKYININNKLGLKSKTIGFGKFINLHMAVNDFNVKEFEKYNFDDDPEYKKLLEFKEFDFCINYNFEKNRITIDKRLSHYSRNFIIFTLNYEGGMIFFNQDVFQKIKLLLYYSKIFNFKNEMMDSFEKYLLTSGS